MKHEHQQRFELTIFNRQRSFAWAMIGMIIILSIVIVCILEGWSDVRLNMMYLLMLACNITIARTLHSRDAILTVKSSSLMIEDVGNGTGETTSIEIRYTDISEYGFSVVRYGDRRLLLIGNDASRTDITFRRNSRTSGAYDAFEQALTKAITSFDAAVEKSHQKKSDSADHRGDRHDMAS